MDYKKIIISGFFLSAFCSPITAAPLAISDTPLFLNQASPPLNLIVMGRDHKLFYEAYDDRSDLNGDGVLDIRYTPSIDYYGYFDSYKCYSYNSSNQRFEPYSTTTDKTCSGQWSGDFLNYLTTSRIDALRKVLYGGYRSTDTTELTVLERAHTPQDAHSWGKEYTSVAVDGFDISNYTPYALPTSGNRHLFANTTLLNSGNGEPLLRVLTNQSYRIWEWVSIERPVANNRVLNGSNGPTVSPTNFVVRVMVCSSTVSLEQNCGLYSSGYHKPTGLLHTFGENNQMKFGLLTGSFGKNLSGGMLRKNISSFTDEINPSTGQFTNTVGIAGTLDRLKIPNFGGSYTHESNCGFIFNRKINEGECRSWGNPIGEMMYEGLRYFSGKTNPTSSFMASGGDDATLGLPSSTWQNPYASDNSNYCARANMIVISDIYPSYDSDQVPGADANFGSVSGDLSPALNASQLGDVLWTQEFGGSRSIFIGQSGTDVDGAPTAKTVTSFGNIRGLAPEEPGKEGSYYSASAAYYGWLNDLSSVTGTQNLTTYSIAMASPLPTINITAGNNTMTLVPFAKSVGGVGNWCNNSNNFITNTEGNFQPTDTIVDFYVENLTSTSGTFRVNFEDVEAGADHDMDAIAQYDYVVNPDNTVTVTVTSTYAAGCIVQHLGYVISGTTDDGAYLVVRDFDTSTSNDLDYFLDTPAGEGPGGNWDDDVALPLTDARTFTPSSTPSASFLKNPLWYAAKWGSFIDTNNNQKPDLATEWDADNNGTPDTYFLVTNPANLETQLSSALNDIVNRTATSSAAALNSGSLSSNSKLYQATFNSTNWRGRLLAFDINATNGNVETTGLEHNGAQWDTSQHLDNTPHSNRKIITYKPSNGNGIPFRWPTNVSNPSSSELDTGQTQVLRTHPGTGLLESESIGSDRLNFLRGDRSNEVANGGSFRDRQSVLGDIIHSNPLYVGPPNFIYPISWPSGSPESTQNYQAFKNTHANRTPIIYVGANDGMLQAIDASTGNVLLSYLPSGSFSQLNTLTDPNYGHRYFVDGSPNFNDVFFDNQWHTVLVGGLNKGGQSIYALNITNPLGFNESNAADIVLWEFSDSDDADLGYTYSQPAIVRLADGNWGAVFGNGYNNTNTDGNISSTGNAVLYLVNIKTGALIKKIDTGVGSADDPLGNNRPNGLATVSVIDTNGDMIGDAVYGGDLFGNLWKFDISNSDKNQWDVAYKEGTTPKPLYVARDASDNPLAITTRPIVGKLNGETNGVQVYFGTGKFLETADKTDLSLQTFYGIEDTGTRFTGRNLLLQQTILSETTSNTINYRITSNNTKNATHRGWYIDLALNSNLQGERVVSQPILRNKKIIFSTLIPSSHVCEFGGTSWLMELNAQNGSRLSYTPFDTNDDDDFTTADYFNYQNSTVPSSGRQSTVGVIPTPSILSTNTDVEYKYTPGTTGNIENISENPGPGLEGRESWRQLK